MQKTLWIGIVLMLISSIFAGVGSVLIKKGSTEITQFNIKNIIFNKFLWLGFICYGLGGIPMILGLKYGQVSILYPIIALSYVWTALIATKFLGENLSVYNWSGFALIIIGVGLIVK